MKSLLSLLKYSLILGGVPVAIAHAMVVSAQAGGGSVGGNGGIGIFCEDRATSELKSVELLDLWEPEDLEIPKSRGPDGDRLTEALNRLQDKPLLKTLIENQLRRLEPLYRPVQKRLPLTNDALPMYRPESTATLICDYGQIAIAGMDPESGEFRVRYDAKAMALLTARDRDALHLHEALYALHRESDRDLENSRAVRRVVAQLFSTSRMTERLIGAVDRIVKIQGAIYIALSDDDALPLHLRITLRNREQWLTLYSVLYFPPVGEARPLAISGYSIDLKLAEIGNLARGAKVRVDFDRRSLIGQTSIDFSNVKIQLKSGEKLLYEESLPSGVSPRDAIGYVRSYIFY